MEGKADPEKPLIHGGCVINEGFVYLLAINRLDEADDDVWDGLVRQRDDLQADNWKVNEVKSSEKLNMAQGLLRTIENFPCIETKQKGNEGVGPGELLVRKHATAGGQLWKLPLSKLFETRIQHP